MVNLYFCLHEVEVLRPKGKQLILDNVIPLSIAAPKSVTACTQCYVQKEVEVMLGFNAVESVFG